MVPSCHRVGWLFALPAALIVSDCSSASQSHRRATRPSREVTARDIERSGARTAWDAVRLIAPQISMSETSSGKPGAIESRGQSSFNLSSQPMIFLDGVQIADFRMLGEMPASQIAGIRFMSGIDVSTRYGTGGGNGAILIRTKRSP
ncbi:MAG: TonB-dependent receptor plug domain-containing protein [Gemmatimonadetes bacterium]|nr:TonB-dependent receptor plug domain-containing protein [Gemmatimonadota bacterium]